MNILVTTLGMSWQIIPELIGFTNPLVYDYFRGNESAQLLREKHVISPVDECWVITIENQPDVGKILAWACHWHSTIKVAHCKDIKDFSTSEEIQRMRSFIYRVVLKASSLTTDSTGKLYLSLSGGRKTMSADMQEAGNLFGCDAMLHIVDCKGIPPEQKNDPLTEDPGKYAQCFMPVIINETIRPSFVISAAETRIVSADYPFEFKPEVTSISFDEDGSLEKAIQDRKERSAQLYSNFYSTMRSTAEERDIFRKLYFLHPDILRKLKNINIANNADNYKRDINLLKEIPKVDLHTHLGGVLSPQEIIITALAESEYIQNIVHTKPAKSDLLKLKQTALEAIYKQDIDALIKNKNDIFSIKENSFYNFYDKLLVFISSFCDDPGLFESLIFGRYTNKSNYQGIGIEAYQRLGDFQGSSLLQSKNTIAKAVELYVEKLIDDNVKYVEIRCSPYKYTRRGMSENEVITTIMDSLDKHSINYRLICIIGREVEMMEIKDSIHKIEKLLKENRRFEEKLVGIDLAGDESTLEPRDLREAFMPFLERCIHVTIHAGETESVDNIWQAVYHLNADRIGHGLKLQDKPELIPRFIDKNIGIEMCPSSNDQIIGYRCAEHAYPLKKYMEKASR